MAGRLLGVDLARGLAVFGMYAAHVGPAPQDAGGVTGFLLELSHGRSSALFAFLAGFSLILLMGRSTPRTGRAGRRAVLHVLIRALVLLALGTALTMTGTPVEVILAYYGLFFALLLPLYRLRPRTLAVLAAATALTLPQLRYLLLRSLDGSAWGERVIAHDPLARLSDTDGFLDLFVTGSYPALAWLSFLLAGMAVARLDLASSAVRVRLAATGAALAALGHGGSWLALHLLPGLPAALAADATWDGPVTASWWSDVAGVPQTPNTAWLWVAAPHSETTLSILANTGIALLVLTACVTALDRLPRLTRWARPVIAVGSMSLTAYVLHIALIWALGIEDLDSLPLLLLPAFIAAALLFATAWSRFFRRGPLEHLLHGATRLAGTEARGRPRT
ncbi:DUF418 domain-containing protein [Streptomyces sp. NPDC127108]|uniref:DUF418 domain-containing protein n=1 Tax=Streptomyces sp. NPDC127108 TaxID=3345361 RepID=UPI0036322BF3